MMHECIIIAMHPCVYGHKLYLHMHATVYTSFYIGHPITHMGCPIGKKTRRTRGMCPLVFTITPYKCNFYHANVS